MDRYPLPDVVGRLASAAQSCGQDPQQLWIVGGLVRDTLLGVDPGYDIDIAVGGDPREFVGQLVAAIPGAELIAEHRFGTATVRIDGWTIDLAMLRTERYDRPGALPEVSPTDQLSVDLARRDITINALAVPLGKDPSSFELSDVIDAVGGLPDLAARTVRILHPDSFLDDPTRIVRAARYAARLGFSIEQGTQVAAATAIAKGGLASLSAERLAHELRIVLAEPAVADALSILHELGTLHERVVGGDLERLRRVAPMHWTVAAAILLEAGYEELGPMLLAGATAAEQRAIDRVASLSALLSTLELPIETDDLVLIDAVAGSMERDEVSQVGASYGDGWGRAIDAYLSRRAGATPELSGDDILRLGVPAGPQVGHILGQLREARLTGDITTIEEERAFVRLLTSQGP